MGGAAGLTTMLGVAVAAVAAFVWGPAALLSSAYPRWRRTSDLEAAVTVQVVDHLDRGTAALPPGLTDLAEYWFWWHAIKVVICLVLLTALAFLATGLWRRSASGRVGIVVATVATTVGAVVALGLLAVNVQSAAVPVVALLPLLPARGTDAALDASRALLGDHVAAGDLDPAEQVLADAVAHYSWTMAGGALVAAALCSAIVVVVRRRRRTTPSRASRGVLVVVGLGAVAFAALGVYEITAAVDASSALLGLIGA